MLNLLAVDATEELEFTEDGTKRKIKVPVSRELKIDICKSLAGFFYPKLNAQQITGPNEGPIEVARANTELERALATPEGVEAAQKLALLMAQADTPPAPARLSPGDLYGTNERLNIAGAGTRPPGTQEKRCQTKSRLMTARSLGRMQYVCNVLALAGVGEALNASRKMVA